MPCDRSNKTFLRRNLIYVIINKDDSLFCRQNEQNKRKRPHCRYFVHVVENATAGYNTSVQPHSCFDFKCLFCGFDAASLTGVWCHFHSDHGHEFDFSYRVTTDWKIHILAFTRPFSNNLPGDDSLPFAAERSTRVTAAQTKWKQTIPDQKCVKSSLLFCFELRHNPKTMEVFPPNRIERDNHQPVLIAPTDDGSKKELFMDLPGLKFFHSRNFQPLTIGDWVADVESEDEIDVTWKKQIAERQLDEFTDVSGPEKAFFKLWNEFVESIPLITERSLPNQCFTFINAHALLLRQKNLEEQLIWHLTNLWDEGLIGQSHVVDCMKRYHFVTSKMNS